MLARTPSASAAGPRPGPAAFRRILCAIDFSPASLTVIEAAVGLARLGGGAVCVLFVVPYEPPSHHERRHVPEGVSDAVTEDVEALLAPARTAGIAVRVCLRVGVPAREIEDEIRRTAPDVVVLGTHGRGGFRRRALGSVATEVLRRRSCPVVTVAQRKGLRLPSGPPPRDGVLCAVALDESSPHTIAVAADLAFATGGRLTLVHVAGPGASRDSAEARLHAAATLARAHGLPPARVEEMVVGGSPVRKILHAAARRDPAYLVVGAHPASADAPAGATGDAVVRGARWPVLTV